MSFTRLCLLLIASCLIGQADLVYNNYTSTSGGGNAVNAFASDTSGTISAIRFTLLQDSVIESIDFSGMYSSQYTIPRPGTDSFTIAFFEDDGSTDASDPDKPIPGPLIGDAQPLQITTEATDRGDTIVFGLPTFDYAGTLPNPVTLGAGTYWISIANDYSGGNHWAIAYAFSGSNLRLDIAVTTAPQTSGYSGIPTNDPIRPFFSLSGTPAPPDVSVSDDTPTHLPSGSLIHLGKVLNGTTTSRTFTLTNHEDEVLTVVDFNQQSNSPGTFTLDGLAPPLALHPGTSTTFSVSFKPSTEGVAYATRAFLEFDGYPGAQFDLNFNGEGVDSTDSFAYHVCVIGGYNGTDALPEADPDGDGLPNLTSYALGLAYGSGTRDDNNLVRTLTYNGTTTLVGQGAFGTGLCYLPEPQPEDVVYILEESSTLIPGDWTEIARRQQNTPWVGNGASQITTEVQADATRKCTIVFGSSQASHPTRFMRLRFELIP
ncbi:choice-of-anchor D domain-containing protein [Haloferula rosea]|uniref:Choice-of-anchor D domain-containing protein n=1 Tax=Haloferula rosea TaxID=490093 RepID=A0A934RDE7_9BACT|nr:choice-of-anchor D domain-containing protein [Haloferula rosea]MBK1827214.1 choice-of-anchor D domain-containing protein [Haloferula rosea]